MAISEQIPLGTRIPNTPHAVSVSIPTMRDVIAYEENDPETRRKMKSGYPRFVVHEYLLEIEKYWQRLFDKPNDPVWLTSSEKMARALESYLDTEGSKFQKHGGVSGLRLPSDQELNLKAKRFLTHVGGYLSSRQAEDYLAANGLLDAAAEEDLCENEASAKIQAILQPLYGTETAEEIILTSCGMNAIYAAFRAINEIQAPRNRKSWIHLGWLYADTMHVLKKLSEGENIALYDVFDLDALEQILEANPDHFAGIITETPTNPLIQTPDTSRLKEIAKKHGVYLVIDPTMNSPANVDVSPYADVIVNSLTKYAANAGDASMGAVALTGSCPNREQLHKLIIRNIELPYDRDIQRLAYQIDDYERIMPIINANTLKIVEWLKGQSGIGKVHWAEEEGSREAYRRIARSSDSVGGVVSIEFTGDMAVFHDRVALAKGPSFGMKQTLVSPFMYLAHYDLIKNEEGKKLMRKAGVKSDLIRMSIGTEPAEEIIEALDFALNT